MAKLTMKEKLMAAQMFVDEQRYIREIVELFGVSKQSVYKWGKRYEKWGKDGFKSSYTSYSVEFKLEVLKFRSDTNASFTDTAVHFNIPSPERIRQWEITFQEKGVSALQSGKKGRPSMKNENKKPSKKLRSTDDSIEALQTELEYLRAENAYLKKLNALVQEKETLQRKKKLK